MGEALFLICAPADSPVAVPGSIFNRVCVACERAVMIAPTGQRRLRETPEMQIICAHCYEERASPDDTMQPAGPIDEMLDEARRSYPNLRRRRN